MRIAEGVAIVFGLLTIVSGGRALFGGPATEAAVGNAVPFVLWFNFLSGFVYVMAGIGIAMGRRWAVMRLNDAHEANGSFGARRRSIKSLGIALKL